MNFRFTLTHSVLGSHEITEPDGWRDAVIKLERHDDFKSLIEYFEGAFIFYGATSEIDGGINFIKQVEQTYGPDADLNILIEISYDDIIYDTVFEGQLDLSTIREMPDNKLQCAIIRNDFWANFINRYDTPVDLQSYYDQDGDDVDVFSQINLNLKPQKLRAKTDFEQPEASLFCPVFDSSFTSPDFQVCVDTDEYLQFDWIKSNLDEVESKYTLSFSGNPEVPVSIFDAEYEGQYTISFKFGITIMNYQSAGPVVSARYASCIDDGTTDAVIDCYVQFNNETPILLTKNNYGSGSVEWSEWEYYVERYLNKGDSIRVYGQFTSSGSLGYGNNTVTVSIAQPVFLGADNSNIEWSYFSSPPVDFTESIDSYFRITADTIYPATNGEGFLIHDAGGQIADRIIGRNETFYSEFLGSDQTVYRQYMEDGCGWTYAILKGLQIRQYSLLEKPFFLSFKNWWDGINPILNLSLGYEEVSGTEVIRIEEAEYQFDSTPSIYIDNVYNIQRQYDEALTPRKLELGYNKWQSEDVSGIDDPQTKRTYATRLKKMGTDIKLESQFIAASLAIETTRRKTKEKSSDYKFDNDTFIIAIQPNPVDVSPETSPDVTDFEPELDENFDYVTNLLNSDTRYNIRLSVSRMLLRWLNWFSGGLQKYLSSSFTFQSGEGNYDMTSEMDAADCDSAVYGGNVLAENQDIQVSNSPVFIHQLYTMEIPMDWEDYKTIRDNRRKPIAISQTTENHVNFYIKTLSFELWKGKATIEAYPKSEFIISIPEDEFEMQPCVISEASNGNTGIEWTLRTSPADNVWIAVTYGDGIFVAVSTNGTGNRAMNSTDGINWTLRSTPVDNVWRSVVYGNGIFVAVSNTGTGNRVMTSPNGNTWTIRSSAADNAWISVTYGDGLFVAVATSGTGNRVMTSPDGISWTIRSSAADNTWRSVTFGNNLFVAVASSGSGNRVMTSPDGVIWTIRTSAANNTWTSVAFGNNLFVAVSTDGTGTRVMTSSDGINWTIRTSAADYNWQSVTYGNGKFVSVASSGTGNRVMTSVDGINWVLQATPADNGWVAVTFGDNRFVATASTGTGNRVMTSP